MNLRRLRPAVRSFIVVLAAAVLLPLMLRWFEHHQVYHPDRVFEATGRELGRAFEEVEFFAADGVRLHGWFFPANAGSLRADWVALVCHGNAGNISHRLDLTGALLSTGVAVFLFDYRGYGRSEGRPSEEGTYRDAQAAHAWLRGKGFRAERILAFGESLGGGVVSELALREPVAGIVLQSAFTSIADIGAELFPWLPVRWLSRIHYDTHRKLPRLQVPVLILHSRADNLVRFAHAERNFAAANEPKEFVELTGDHHEAIVDTPRITAAIAQWLQRLESPPAAKSPLAPAPEPD